MGADSEEVSKDDDDGDDRIDDTLKQQGFLSSHVQPVKDLAESIAGDIS